MFKRSLTFTDYSYISFDFLLIDPTIIIYKNHVAILVRNTSNQALCCALVTAVSVKSFLLLSFLAAAGAVLPGFTLRPRPAVSGRSVM